MTAANPAAADERDPYQERYEAHQQRKARTLVEIMWDRHSDRMFDNRPVPDELREQLVAVAGLCPSSCDRRAVHPRPVTARDDLALLSGLLVGGVGWIHRAPLVLLLMADPAAYKAGDEIQWMPYLDAGVMVQQLLLAATDMGLAAAYCNPNIRDRNLAHFRDQFGDYLFCGAVAVGYSHPNSPDRLRHEQAKAAGTDGSCAHGGGQ